MIQKTLSLDLEKAISESSKKTTQQDDTRISNGESLISDLLPSVLLTGTSFLKILIYELLMLLSHYFCTQLVPEGSTVYFPHKYIGWNIFEIIVLSNLMVLGIRPPFSCALFNTIVEKLLLAKFLKSIILKMF